LTKQNDQANMPANGNQGVNNLSSIQNDVSHDNYVIKQTLGIMHDRWYLKVKGHISNSIEPNTYKCLEHSYAFVEQMVQHGV
jgi:hypothetical protein